MCQKAAPLKNNLFTKVKVCVWDVGGGFAGIGGLMLMPDRNGWGGEGSENVY